MPQQNAPATPTQLLRKPAVCARVALFGTTLWRLARAGKFPKSIQISAGAVAWREADIEDWIDERVKAAVR